MGIMATADHTKSTLIKMPFYTSIFYTFNTLMFGLGLMDSMLRADAGHPDPTR